MSKQKNQRITAKERSRFLYNGPSYLRWTHTDPNNDAVSVLLPVRTSSLASFSRRKPCRSCFTVLCRWPTITTGFDVGPFRWWRKWFSADQELPSSSNQALEECDNELFPNIHTLLPFLCTLPVTSVECEWSFSALRWLKTLLRATITMQQARVWTLACTSIVTGK